MMDKIRFSAQWTLPVITAMCLLVLFICVRPVGAITPIPTPSPIPGSYGLEATKPQPPPTQAATITIPGGGASFTTSPIDVKGICLSGLLVQVYDNGVMVGSVMCTNGNFSLQVSLFAGSNELSAIVYDDLEQAGPTSNTVTVNYTDTHLTAFGALVTLTSSYGRRSSAANIQLSWPLQLSGGAGPYAFSIDWGDNSKPELKSQPIAGVLAVAHVYKKAGIYPVNVKVADVNGVSAFLQVVAVASGKVDASTSKSTNTDSKVVKPQILWLPTAVALVLLIPSFWLGRRSQMISIRNKMLKERDNYEKEQKKS